MHEVHGACPLDCPDGCSWVVTVDDAGRAVNLKGNREHPFTAGALCAKLNGYLEHTRAPDRLLYPLKRVGRKGEGKFERIGWDEALQTIAAELHAVRDEFGGEAIWPFQGTGTLGYVQGLEGRAGQRLWNVLGASRHDMTACSVAGRQGAAYVTGTAAGMDPETFEQSKLILLWGTNTLTSGHHLWKFILKARKQGAHIVAIDPLRTRTAAQADEHLAPLPGTDAALALGLLNVIVTRGAEDREYLSKHTLGWPEFKERILAFPPSQAAAITGIDEATIVALGERIATTRPTGIRCTMGMQRHAGGGNALRLLYVLPGVTGDWQYPGGGASYSTSGRFRPDIRAIYRDDLLTEPVRRLSMTLMGRHLLSDDDPPVKALVIYGANPMSSNPDQHAVRRGLEREDLFTVVIEQFPTDTVDYADIVLPATMQTEHLDLNDGYGHSYVHLNRKAVEPPGECLSTMETFRRLARAISCSGWAEFRSMLEYKARRHGRTVVAVDRWYPSSKTCSACGHLLADFSLSTRTWQCPSCGAWHDRDVNAAKNILAAGLAAGTGNGADACGGDVRRARATRTRPPAKQDAQPVREGILVFSGGEDVKLSPHVR